MGRIGAMSQHFVRRLSLTLAGAATLAAASTAYQLAGDARDRRRDPAPGRLLEVNGRQLHIRCAGQGSPAIVIIPALGDSSDPWMEVLPVLAQHTRVCVYDRAGLGWSQSPRRRRTGAGMAADLRSLLRQAGVGPPYLLAGHSLGGLVAQLYAVLYPAEVAAVALIDSSHPRQDRRLPRMSVRDYPGGQLLDAARTWARPLGLRRAARDLGLRPVEPGYLIARRRRAVLGERLAFSRLQLEVGQLGGDLGSLPLTVVTSSAIDPNCPPGSEAAQKRAQFYPEWATLQDELAGLSADSKHVVAQRAGHHVHLDDPELVTGAIIALLHRARQARPQ
jgi:pimeloyl-ACP methyl ester carboxylesterase